DSDALETLYRVATCAIKKPRYEGDILAGVHFAARRGKLTVAATTSRVAALGTVPRVVLDDGESWHVTLAAAPFRELKKGGKWSYRRAFLVIYLAENEARIVENAVPTWVSVLGGGFPDLAVLLPGPGEEPEAALGDLMLNPEFYAQAF